VKRLAPDWHLNSIATRLAVMIMIAIGIGVALEVAVGVAIARFTTPMQSPAGAPMPPVAIAFRLTDHRDPHLEISVGGNPAVLASTIATIARLVGALAPDDRARIAAAAAPPDMHVAIRDVPLIARSDGGAPELRRLHQLIAAELGIETSSPTLLIADLDRLGFRAEIADPAAGEGNAHSLLVETKLADGQWLAITRPGYATRRIGIVGTLAIASPPFVLIGLLSIFAARRLAAPIRDFAIAAERLGIDSTAPPLNERGPHELRVAIRAFNGMQQRLQRFVEDRTQMLAAMSHDLRTPLHRLRLRAEFMHNEEQQRKVFSDIEAMNAMIDATLSFARDDRKREPSELVDLAIMVEDLCEDAADAGAPVTFSGAHGANVRCRPRAISRAVSNLVENAVKYGRVARVCVTREPGCFSVTVDDDGPGIPLDQQEKVFAPFYRLEPSRNPDTGGIGLGLSVARTIAREHGGEVRLINHDAGGLRARLELPIACFDRPAP